MRAFVVDASIAIAWVHPAQSTARSVALLEAVRDGARVKAPALWSLETANALLVLTRRGKLTQAERRTALAALSGLAVELDHETASLAYDKVSDLALKHGLSVYDAAYLELAARSELPLASADIAMRRAAKRCRVELAA